MPVLQKTDVGLAHAGLFAYHNVPKELTTGPRKKSGRWKLNHQLPAN
jgi:hypothetical protein